MSSSNQPRLRFFGYRLLCCVSDDGQAERWVDVPEHFGRFYPSTLTLPDRTVSGPREGQWYADQLRRIVDSEEVAYRIKIDVRQVRNRSALVVNCLDPIFGHALYKLTAAQALRQEYPERDIVVLVSANLQAYAQFSDVQILIDEPLGMLMRRNVNLDTELQIIHRHYEDVQWAFCNTSRTGSQSVLPTQISDGEPERTLVTFIHRDDRTWGPLSRLQVSRVNKVFRSIKRDVGNVRTAVIGVSSWPHRYIVDENHLAPSYGANFDTAIEHIARRSRLVIGVHGSNMLIPSYHALSTIELLPKNRLGNATQAFWPNPNRSTLETLFSYRVLTGDNHLLSITANHVAGMAIAMINGLPGFQARQDSSVILRKFVGRI